MHKSKACKATCMMYGLCWVIFVSLFKYLVVTLWQYELIFRWKWLQLSATCIDWSRELHIKHDWCLGCCCSHLWLQVGFRINVGVFLGPETAHDLSQCMNLGMTWHGSVIATVTQFSALMSSRARANRSLHSHRSGNTHSSSWSMLSGPWEAHYR